MKNWGSRLKNIPYSRGNGYAPEEIFPWNANASGKKSYAPACRRIPSYLDFLKNNK
jgi:hypothetical protein